VIRVFCESQSNNTTDIVNKNQFKKAINEIGSDLDDNVCINKILKILFVLT